MRIVYVLAAALACAGTAFAQRGGGPPAPAEIAAPAIAGVIAPGTKIENTLI